MAAASRWAKRHDVAVVNLWNGGGMLKDASRRENVRFVGVDGGSRLFRLSAANALRAVFRRESFDVVLVFGLRLQLLTRVLRPYLSPHAVWITMLRGQDIWRNKLHVLADRWTQRRFDCHVGCSRAVCDVWAARERYPVDRLVFIPNGIDLARFSGLPAARSSRRELGLPEGEPRLHDGRQHAPRQGI